jgi:hypothetical protein
MRRLHANALAGYADVRAGPLSSAVSAVYGPRGFYPTCSRDLYVTSLVMPVLARLPERGQAAKETRR